MNLFARALCVVALALSALGVLAAAAAHSATDDFVTPTRGSRAPASESPLAQTTTTTNTTTTTSTVAAPMTTAPPVGPRSTGRAASCGWMWDAMRVEDGSSNEVTMMLDAPSQASQSVTITVKPGASLTSTPPIARATTTDDAGQASATFALSNDKRDWTLTVSATFASGAACPPQTFTLEY